MDRFGFIHEKLDIKILILYILNQLPSPVDAQTLSELVFCDDGIGYFDYSDCLAELVETNHIEEKRGKYRITEKGSRNVAEVGSSLPYSVRTKASHRGKNAPRRNDHRRAYRIGKRRVQRDAGAVGRDRQNFVSGAAGRGSTAGRAHGTLFQK